MDPDLARRLDEIDAHRYVSVTTFRRSGEPVTTPMWVARSGDAVVLISVDGQGKVKRLAHTPRVELRPCDLRGRVPDGAPVWHGTASLVRDPAGLAEVRRAMSAKYLLARIGNLAEDLLGRLVHRQPRVGIRVAVQPRGSDQSPTR